MEGEELIQKNPGSFEVEQKESVGWRYAYITLITLVLLVAAATIVYSYNLLDVFGGWIQALDSNFYLFMMAGFIAQMIDGALGMAYGVSASTFLLSFGVPPAAASASIHTSEIFTSGVSGLMHLRFQNVNKKLFKTLLIPGVVGAALGAYVLSSLEQYNDYLKPVIAVYTLYLGIVIIRKAIVGSRKKIKTKNIPKLATFGGFMDSIGGGGWGPIVSSTLIAGGRHPRYTIGSVNLTEFFVALASSLTFIAVIGISHWQIIAGLIAGGVIAAPIAAYLSSRLPLKRMMIFVGIMVILVSVRIIFKSLTAW
jgi:uncharacterized membrane protein YfcA